MPKTTQIDLGKVKSDLKKYREAKREHQADGHEEDGCTRCHFWSGSIAVLADLLGEVP
jgi:hypothetical protein